jgi:hypothetical protein
MLENDAIPQGPGVSVAVDAQFFVPTGNSRDPVPCWGMIQHRKFLANRFQQEQAIRRTALRRQPHGSVVIAADELGICRNGGRRSIRVTIRHILEGTATRRACEPSVDLTRSAYHWVGRSYP